MTSWGARRGERLRVGVGDDEVDAGQVGDDHVIDCVAARAAHAAHHDAGLQLFQLGGLQIDRHTVLPLLLGARRRRLVPATAERLASQGSLFRQRRRCDACPTLSGLPVRRAGDFTYRVNARLRGRRREPQLAVWSSSVCRDGNQARGLPSLRASEAIHRRRAPRAAWIASSLRNSQ